MISHLLKLFTFILILQLCINSSQAQQQLPQDEIESVQWILSQYRSILQLDPSSFCNNITFNQNVSCQTTSNGEYHVLGISLDIIRNNNSQLAPNPALTKFKLPYLINLLITSTVAYDESLNILDRISDLSNLEILLLQSDPTISYIPQSLSQGGFPKLTRVSLSQLKNLHKIEYPVFENASLNALSIYGVTYLTSLSINSSWNHPKLTSLSFTINPLDVSQFDLDINEGSFPLLDTLYANVYTKATPPPGIVDLNLDFTKLKQLDVNGIDPAFFKVNMIKIPTLTALYNSGCNIWNPPDLGSIPLTGYPSYVFKNCNYTATGTYPFPNGFGSTIGSVLLDGVIIPSLPNLPVPSSLKQLTLTNNSFVGDAIPWSIFVNSSTSVWINGNPGLTGSVPDSACSLKFPMLRDVYGTQMTLPDCFWCYSNDSKVLNTTLTRPTDLTCDIKINTTTLYLINGTTKVYGSNIGWGTTGVFMGKPYSLDVSYPNIPNKLLTFKFTSSPYFGSKAPIQLKLNTNTPQFVITVDLLEVGLEFSNKPILYNQLSTGLGINISLTLFNNFTVHNVTIDDTLVCTIDRAVTSQYLYCIAPGILPGSHKISIKNEYLVKTTTFYYKQYYPLVKSFDYDRNDFRNISLYGNFGIFLNNPSVYLNETSSLNCVIKNITTDYINCYLENLPPGGSASVFVIIDTFIFSRPDALYFPGSNGGGDSSENVPGDSSDLSPKEQCIQDHNCYGHGQCQDNGECHCEPEYNPEDNCRSKFTNTTPVIDPTTPTASFDINGIDFQFEIIAIQELDANDTIIKELPTDLWQSTINSTSTFTLANYQLNITNATDIESNPNVQVTATISFSTAPRSVQFGPRQMEINPNSIKLAVNITNWEFYSILSYLRVVFKTSINNNQTYRFNCNDHPIESLSFDEYGSTLQYLRVVKDNVQYDGRFIDYSLADGRPTYSRTQLISLTPNIDDDTTSTAVIGVLLSQCQECLLDPDFTPLLIEKGNSECEESNNNWRIIVGCVVGGVGAIAIATGSVMLYKKKQTFNRNENRMKKKIQAMSQ